MAHADFVHLRVHSAYSLSEGAIRIPELAALSAEMAMPAVAITDRNNLFGAMQFSETIANAGVQPIIGCTLAFDPKIAGQDPHAAKPDLDWIVLLAKDQEGYAGLVKLVSRAHLGVGRDELPHLSIADLVASHHGLIALSGAGDGTLARLITERRIDAARAHLLAMKAMFGDRYYVEIARHGDAVEKAVEESLLDLAFDHGTPIVATNQCFFARENQYRAHDALICIAQGTVVGNPNRKRFSPEYRFKSAAEMRALFADLPEAIENTLLIAQRCAVKAEKRAPILPNFAEGKAVSEADLLREAAAEGLKKRLADHAIDGESAKPYQDRLELELKIIVQMGFPGYFLIVADFIQWAKDQGIPVGPGRGSGAGSLVAWSLKITDLDPLRFGLLFERFLNPERISMPDFDIDFCQDRRDEVIRYVQSRYGEAQVAQIITYGKLQARAVLRDVGRVLEVPRGEVDGLAKLVPNNPAKPVTLQQAIDGEPKLKAAMRDRDVKQLIDTALELEGLYRHTSTHAAGVVIGDRPLDELVPLYRDPRSDMPVTQYDMGWVEKAGLVKFDFLGLKTLTVLKTAVDHIARRGVVVDIDRVPYDDPLTYQLLSAGETHGVFQLESDGMRTALMALKPDKLEDIIAMVALYRPGPMDNIPSFIARKHGREAIGSLHPSLEPVLSETYGVIIYQEQVMQIAQILAGYSLGEADLLRRAMGKKKKEEMDAQRARFVSGAKEKGVDRNQASFIFDLVAKFAGYGFNKSHAAAYAVVAYQTAYLKANYPVEFMAASMTYDMGNTDKLAGYVAEARRLGIPVLPPDVNQSEVRFAVEAVDPERTSNARQQAQGRAIRYALAAIKNVGEAAMAKLVADRAATSRYRDPYDFAERLDPQILNKRLLENLIRAGAFDSVNPNRAQSFAAIEQLLLLCHDAHERKQSNQVNLFDDGMLKAALPPLPQVTAPVGLAALEDERSAVGFYLSGHPLDAFQAQLAKKMVGTAAMALAKFNGESRVVTLAGIIEELSERRTKSGKPFVSLRLTDQDGGYEVSFFREEIDAARRLAQQNKPVLMGVAVERVPGSDRISLTGRSIAALDDATTASISAMRVDLRDPAAALEIQQLLADCGGGRGNVHLHYHLADINCEVEIRLPGGHRLSPQLHARVTALAGVRDAALL